MVVDEDERPDNWQCQAVFENRSSFAVDLVKLQVRMSGSNDLLFDISDVEDDVLPDGKWESEVKVVEANERPDFTNELGYTVLPRVSHCTEGSISLEEQVFDVLEAQVDKKYDAGVLRSYREQIVNATMTISNTGSSDINLMRVTDDIPGLFNAPDLDALRIHIDGKLLSTEQYRCELKDGISLEEFRKSPDGSGNTMTMTIGTKGPLGLGSGKSLEVTYSLVAPDPSPDNTEVAAPAKCEFSAERFGPVCTRAASTDPVIRVRHDRRRFSAGKTVIPVGGQGRYEVLIMFENRSDSALKDLIIHDVLPVSFDIQDCVVRGAGRDERKDVEMSSESGDSGTNVQWHVPVIAKGEKLEVSYEIKGSGVFDAQEMQKFHGATFGDEVEEDPGLASMAGEEPEVPAPTASELNKMKKAELVAMCDAAGLDTSGTKKVLIERILAPSEGEADEEAEEAPAEEAGEEAPAEDAEASAEENAEAPAEEATAEEAAPVEEGPAEDAGAAGQSCPICSALSGANDAACGTCGFTFA